MRKTSVLSIITFIVAACASACGGSTTSGQDSGAPDGSADSGIDAGLDAGIDGGADGGVVDGGSDTGLVWNRGNPPSSLIPKVREWTISRTIIHAHTVYSHDACDDLPWIDPADPENKKACENWWTNPACVPNQQCIDDLRTGLCTDAIDAIFMSDHRGTLAHEGNFDNLYVDNLYTPPTDDNWITEDNIHTGRVVRCSNGNSTIFMVGSENDIMPVGLTSHPPGDEAERSNWYGRKDAEAVQVFKDHGAVVAVQHSEGQTVDYLRNTPVDAMEIYNFHVSLLSNLGPLLPYLTEPQKMPPADLSFLAFYKPLEVQITKWYSTVFARDVTAFMGTDIHRNTVPKEMPDGERFDSYRRFMRWFSNYVLVKEIKPSTLKEAIRAGRLFVVAEALGTPQGFDFYAESGGGITEQGLSVDHSSSLKLVAKKPNVLGVPETSKDIKLVLMKIGDGTAVAVKEYEGDMEATGLEKGVYYVEVRFTPYYMKPFFGNKKNYADEWIHEFVWIYSNAIRIK